MKRILIAACYSTIAIAFLVGSNVVLAQEGATLTTSEPKGKVADIEAYVGEIDQLIKGSLRKERYFANVATGAKYEVSAWQELKSEEERQKNETSDNLKESATVWQLDGKVVGVKLVLRSATGDSTQNVMYYFRNDGSLAKSDSRLNAIVGSISVRRQDYYDSKGTVLKGTTQCRDLKTQQFKPCGDYQDKPAPYYKSARNLPFYGLLK